MWWRKKEFLRQRIKMHADPGQSTMCIGLFFILFLSVLLVSHLQMEMFRSSSDYMEDALAASGLASALIDIKEYGKTHVVNIPDTNAAYERYCQCLKENLGLDDNWEAGNRKLITGKVKVENYSVYNVAGADVEIWRMDGDMVEHSTGRLGEVQAPNGQVIHYTSIYSEISYRVQGVFDIQVDARKGKLVDIVGK